MVPKAGMDDDHRIIEGTKMMGIDVNDCSAVLLFCDTGRLLRDLEGDKRLFT